MLNYEGWRCKLEYFAWKKFVDTNFHINLQQSKITWAELTPQTPATWKGLYFKIETVNHSHICRTVAGHVTGGGIAERVVALEALHQPAVKTQCSSMGTHQTFPDTACKFTNTLQ